jgi:hypothetical protein
MAREATRLEVVADGDKWNVREVGIGRLSSHATQVEATNAARAVARIHRPCELTIRNADGTTESERT